MPKLIDTNVMLAASAILRDLSGLTSDASPPQPELRQLVYDALKSFEESAEAIVLDDENLIRDEYERNMPYYNQAMHSQEYGMHVLQQKLDRSEVSIVTIDVDESTGEKIGKIAEDLAKIVTDRADHKWIAAAESHSILYSNLGFPPIVYGAESDWFHIEAPLNSRGFRFERILPEWWYQQRHQP
jgi:hypothetical protein